MKKEYKIMVVVGEISGDAHAAKLIKELRVAKPKIDFEFFGATGKQMREIGVETIVKADDFARVGILEVATALPMFYGVFRKLKKIAIERKTDAVILVDFPDFNTRLAKALKPKGIKTIYYISPQVWAWKKRRVKKIKKYVDLLLTILPFEKQFYAKHDFHKVEYVGNPNVGEVKPKLTKKEFFEKHNFDLGNPLIALLPGSRKNEIARILPVLIETASLMAMKNNNLQFVIPLASVRKMSEVEEAFATSKANGITIPDNIKIVQGETYEAVCAVDVAAVTSGTATLETAILETPMAIVYKVSALNYLVLKNFISIEHIGLVNLIAQKRMFKEMIQDDFNPIDLSSELFRLLEENENKKLRSELKELKKTLGVGGASKKAANAIIKELGL